MAAEQAKDPRRGRGRRPGADGSLLEPRHDPEEPGERRAAEDRDRERYLADRPPHHEPR